jgi:hypothetical protein
MASNRVVLDQRGGDPALNEASEWRSRGRLRDRLCVFCAFRIGIYAHQSVSIGLDGHRKVFDLIGLLVSRLGLEPRTL